jgi:hypothetical protein
MVPAMNPQHYFVRPLTKRVALDLLGGSVASAADAIGITAHAVRSWPAILSPMIADRVEAAWYRRQNAREHEAKRRWAYAQEAGHAPDDPA